MRTPPVPTFRMEAGPRWVRYNRDENRMDRFRKHERVSGWVVLALLAIGVGAARAESMEELRKSALDASVERSEAALKKLTDMGRPGQVAARAAVREIL